MAQHITFIICILTAADWDFIFRATEAAAAFVTVIVLSLTIVKFFQNEKQRDVEVASLKKQTDHIGRLVNLLHFTNIDRIRPFYTVTSRKTNRKDIRGRQFIFRNYGKRVQKISITNSESNEYELIKTDHRMNLLLPPNSYTIFVAAKNDKDLNNISIKFILSYEDGIRKFNQTVTGTIEQPIIEEFSLSDLLINVEDTSDYQS